MSRVFTAITFVFAIGLTAGCGYRAASDEPSASTQAAPARTAPKPTVKGLDATATDSDDVGGSGSMMIFSNEGDATKPLREIYSVLGRPRDRQDAAAEAAARVDGYLPETETANPGADTLGKPIYSETRAVGPADAKFYIVPTTTNSLCWGLMPNGGGGCATAGPHGLTVSYDDEPGRGRFVVYGLAGDDVRAVELVINGVTRQAPVEKNAYLLAVDDGRGGSIDKIVLHLGDGTTEEIG